MSLPQGLNLAQTQNTWATALDPLISRPANNSIIIKDQALKSGANVINHRLGRKLQGWTLVRIRASATVYDTQDANVMPELTLQLTASADVTVDIEVF